MEEEQASRRATRRTSKQIDRECGGGAKKTNASVARGIGQKKAAANKVARGQQEAGKKAEDKGPKPTPRKRVSTVNKDADVASAGTEPGPSKDGTTGSNEDSGRGSASLALPSAEMEGSTTEGNHGGDPRAEHAATKESEAAATQHHLMLLQPTVVEVSAAVLDKDKVGEHESMGLVGGSPPSGGRGRRRQRKSDGEDDYDTAVPGDLITRAKRRQTTGSADDAGGAAVGTPRGAKEASGSEVPTQ
ncbi:unnamed protein product [Closterium sp. NIES-54]